MRSPSDEEWKSILIQQEEVNKQLSEQSKQFEKAKKQQLNQEYIAYLNEKQRKNQEHLHKQQIEQQEIQNQLHGFKEELEKQVQAQRKAQSALSLDYLDQIRLQKQQQEDKKKQQLLQDEQNADRFNLISSHEDDKKFKQKQDAHKELALFYSQKKQQQQEDKERGLNHAKKGMLNDSSSESNLFFLGGREQSYKKNFSDKSILAAQRFLPIENDKEKRIQDLIEKGAELEKQRFDEQEEKRRQILNNRRLDLKNGLQMQLALKEKIAQEKRQSIIESQNDILQKSIDQEAIKKQERQKRLNGQLQYRDQLDFQVAEIKSNKETNKHIRANTTEKSNLPISPQTQNDNARYFLETQKKKKQQQKSITQQNDQTTITDNYKKITSPLAKITGSIHNMSSMYYNPLVNPVSTNMQNPYLVKQFMGQNPSSLANASRISYANLAQANIMTSNKSLIY